MSNLTYIISATELKINRNYNFLKDPHEIFFDDIQNVYIRIKS